MSIKNIFKQTRDQKQNKNVAKILLYNNIIFQLIQESITALSYEIEPIVQQQTIHIYE